MIAAVARRNTAASLDPSARYLVKTKAQTKTVCRRSAKD
jgi:hypothetical protein